MNSSKTEYSYELRPEYSFDYFVRTKYPCQYLSKYPSFCENQNTFYVIPLTAIIDQLNE